MKKWIVVLAISMAFPHAGNAQFLKKLKGKVLGKEQHEGLLKGMFVSENDQVFKKWDLGEADIVLSFHPSDSTQKGTERIGGIKENGSFSYQMPDSIRTSVPIRAFISECTNKEEAIVKNDAVTISPASIMVGQNNRFIGYIIPASTVKTSYNTMGGGIMNNGHLGHYYLPIYASGDATVKLDCIKKVKMEDGKGFAFKTKVPVDEYFDYELKKGLNQIDVHVIDNLLVGQSYHFIERGWSVVDEIPSNTLWVFIPIVNK
ncbi:hypothetical protein HZY62_16430 [Maribacter polysiphoniae]|uniref:Uncharacterized protein n=1 Tax=Maribacter polysiphoniae TaxID=429344 RepID=A0A316EF01_9FLAO|nr:hypothetical protein [Maribacter polysiphoniae]MBD1262189.1 hypothetical protein [Maribacter polysiphoniae]PWK21550.1 hypothetical protein LX92_03701 [Maribacter polysiphoniae]